MAQIDIVVGTVYGAAMLVAETLADELERKGHHCSLHEEARLAD
ncbi:MAG: flavodoxin, partial [Aeromonas veronii]